MLKRLAPKKKPPPRSKNARAARKLVKNPSSPARGPPPEREPPPPQSPDMIVRWRDGPIYFGVKLTQMTRYIERGEIPQPMYLTDTGRTRGWRGETIMKWQRERAEKTAARLAADRLPEEET